ncbi:hypothetical protein AB3N60_01075 [Leptospira sp. WS39.C2]
MNLRIFQTNKIKPFLITFLSVGIFYWLPPFLFHSKTESKVLNFGFYYLSLNPFTKDTPWDQFLTPWFLYNTGFVSKPEDLVFILNVITILAGVIFVGFISFRFDWVLGLGISLILASSPLFLIFQTWIGFSDPITFLILTLYLIFLFSEFNPKLKIFLLSFVLFLGMTNHFFQILILVILLNVFYLIHYENKSKILIFSFLLAIVLYGLFLVYLFKYSPITWNQTRITIFSQMWGNEFIRMNQSEIFLGIVGLFHSLWPLVVYLIFRIPISLLGFIFCYLVAMMTYDTSRIFAILSTPILLFFTIQSSRMASENEKRIWLLFSFLSPLICKLYPLFYKWDGRIIYLQ